MGHMEQIQAGDELIDFWVIDHGAEFEVESNRVEAISIGSLVQHLKKHQSQRYSDNFKKAKSSSVDAVTTGDLVISVVRDKSPWLDHNWIFIELVESKIFPVMFSLKSAVDLHERQVVEILRPAIRAYPVEVAKVRPIKEGEAYAKGNSKASRWELSILIEGDRMTVSQLIQARFEISISLFFAWDQTLSPRGTLEIIRHGGVGQVVGRSESDIFEAKSSAYELQQKPGEVWKFQLAQDVARFANSENGGLLVVGLHTKKRDGVDTVDKITPIPVSSPRIDTYRQSIDARIHPPVEGMEIIETKFQEGQILCIYVPPQREENKPYLVQGGMVGEKYESSAISIVRRRGDGSIAVTAREIHAALVAGNAFLRRGGVEKS
ncbi:AlbA family DNA-binding domain-containing protein [Spirillospora sp. CA-255316]